MENFNKEKEFIKNVINLLFKSFDTTFFTNRFSKDSTYIFQYFTGKYDIIFGDINDAIESIGLMDEEIQVNNYLYFLYKKNLNRSNDNVMISDELDEIQNIILLHFLYRVRSMVDYKVYKVSNYDQYISKIQDYKNNYWYRGNTKFHYELIPTIYRDIERDNIYFTYTYIKDDFIKKGLASKTASIFGHASLGYNEMAYIQHSIGYTPLLDFTKNLNVATSFALSDFNEISTFFHNNGAIYILDVSNLYIIDTEIEADRVIKNQEVEVYKRKPFISTIIQSKMWNRLVINNEESIVHLIDIPTNDRMRYQRGTFLIFDKVLIIGDKMLMSSRKSKFISSRIEKIELNKSLKFYNSFNNRNPEFQKRYLMNPYMYLSE